MASTCVGTNFRLGVRKKLPGGPVGHPGANQQFPRGTTLHRVATRKFQKETLRTSGVDVGPSVKSCTI